MLTKIWNILSEKKIRIFVINDGLISLSLAISKNDNFIAIGRRYHTEIKIYSVQSGQYIM